MRTLRFIQPSGTRNSAGRVFDEAEPCHTTVRDDYDARPESLWIGVDKPAGAALVQLTIGEGVGGGQTIRRFHVDGRGVWLAVVGWRYAKLEIVNLPADFKLSFCWLTQSHLSNVRTAMHLLQVARAGSLTTPIPEGAIGVTPSRNEAGASWTTPDGVSTFSIPASLVAGVQTDTRGAQLTYAAPLPTDLTLWWDLELI